MTRVNPLRRTWRFVYRHRNPLRSVVRAIKVGRVDEAKLVEDQVRRFAAVGLDWHNAHSTVEGLVGKNDDPTTHRSEHYELLAAVVQSRPICSVLEIGTAEGEFTSFIARLLPNADITTVDLPSSDRRFWRATRGDTSTREGGAGTADVRARDARLAAHTRVRLLEMNSLELSAWDGARFDLVWVDGDHSYPVVVVDIINALRLLRPGGVIMCDDVYLASAPRSVWVSDETTMTLRALEEARLIRSTLVLKKLFASKNYDVDRRKYVALVEPIAAAWVRGPDGGSHSR
jgi:predicted O-methyltransferase YrrM